MSTVVWPNSPVWTGSETRFRPLTVDIVQPDLSSANLKPTGNIYTHFWLIKLGIVKRKHASLLSCMDKNCKSEEKMGHVATYHSSASLSAARLQAFIHMVQLWPIVSLIKRWSLLSETYRSYSGRATIPNEANSLLDDIQNWVHLMVGCLLWYIGASS